MGEPSISGPPILTHLQNQTAISAIRLQSPQSIIRFYLVVPLGVHIPECVKHPAHRFRLQYPQSDCNLSNQTAISAIRLQSQKSDCNLSNQTAISAIRLQSQQSMMRFYHVVHIGVHIPECVKHPAHCLRLQFQQSDCNLSNLTAISAIRLQSPQSDCNISNHSAIPTI